MVPKRLKTLDEYTLSVKYCSHHRDTPVRSAGPTGQASGTENINFTTDSFFIQSALALWNAKPISLGSPDWVKDK